jgi:hypothetical protein
MSKTATLRLPQGESQVVMVAGADGDEPEQMAAALTEMGHHVIGPVATASLALAHAAQTPISSAVVFRRLAGRRDGSQLAQRLNETWGIPTLIVGRSDHG